MQGNSKSNIRIQTQLKLVSKREDLAENDTRNVEEQLEKLP